MTDINAIYKSVLEADRAAVVICDLEHTVIYMNPVAIERYAKWGGNSLMGKSLLNCHNEKSRELIALRGGDGKLIGYYEKHEYRDRETMKMYDIT